MSEQQGQEGGQPVAETTVTTTAPTGAESNDAAGGVEVQSQASIEQADAARLNDAGGNESGGGGDRQD